MKEEKKATNMVDKIAELAKLNKEMMDYKLTLDVSYISSCKNVSILTKKIKTLVREIEISKGRPI